MMLSTYDIYLAHFHLTNNSRRLNTRKSMNRLLPTTIELSGPHALEFRQTAHSSLNERIVTTKRENSETDLEITSTATH